MKKLIPLLLIALMVVILGSCVGNKEPIVLQDSENNLVPPEKLTDETITSLIDADLSISKFLYTGPPTSDYDDTADYNGTTYYRITDERYDTWSEWESYVLSAYCGELAEIALSSNTIVNIDGNSYSNGGGRGYDLSDNYTYEITSSDDDSATVLMRNPARDPDDDYAKETTYTFKLTDSGWRIESN